MAGERSEEVEQQTQEQELDALIDRIAREIVRRGMETPAVMMLELNKPLAFIASQSLLVAMPVLAAFVDPSKVEMLSEAMKSEKNIDRLIERIEDAADEKDRKLKEQKSQAG